MKKQILAYMAYVKGVLAKDDPGTDWEEFARRDLVKIQFYQHERLIHLIVTALFAVMEVICVMALLVSGNLWAMALMAMILVLLIPYVGHYYFLENSVQEMYLLHDQVLERIDRKNKA